MVERHAQYDCTDDNLDCRDMHYSDMYVTVKLSGSEFSSVTNWNIRRDNNKDL